MPAIKKGTTEQQHPHAQEPSSKDLTGPAPSGMTYRGTVLWPGLQPRGRGERVGFRSGHDPRVAGHWQCGQDGQGGSYAVELPVAAGTAVCAAQRRFEHSEMGVTGFEPVTSSL